MFVTDPKTVNPFSDNDETAPRETPPLTVMSLSARSIVNHQANKKEIVSTSARVWQDSKLEIASRESLYIALTSFIQCTLMIRHLSRSNHVPCTQPFDRCWVTGQPVSPIWLKPKRAES